MQLPWRDVDLGSGPISTSLTEGETFALAVMAAERNVLEVGAAYGYSTVVLAKKAKQVVSFDPHFGYGSMPNGLRTYQENLERYGVADKVVQRHERFSLAAAQQHGTFDLVFIDGDHRYESVKEDIEDALVLLAPNGVLACHDYGEDNCPGVRQAIDEIVPDGHLEVDSLWVYRT